MVTKRDLIITVMATFCLTATLFVIIPINSSPDIGGYNPWLDIDDDGKIDMRDVSEVCRAFGARGDPINKTALLYEVNDTFTELLSKIDGLNDSVIALQSDVAYLTTKIAVLQTELAILNATLTQQIENLEATIANLETSLVSLQDRVTDLEVRTAEMNATIVELETKLAILNATKLGKPDYDSFEEYGGWKYIEPDDHWRFDHELNTTNVMIYLVFSNDTTGTNINHRYYGTTISSDFWAGAWWCDLTNDYVMVYRYAESDECAYVRVMIWKIPES